MEKIIIIRIILALWLVAETLALTSPSVTTKLMTIIGKYNKSYKGKLYKIFEGIPYAQPPVGENRFQPPSPIVTRSDKVVFATKDPNMCIQYDYQTTQIVGQEDCLYLNVYVPMQKLKNRPLRPIIIWFHEGAFQRGAGTYTKAKYLMDRDVILVTFNYRLGLFGFLSTEDNVVSGNMGLKDQNLAIKWVVDNIRFFGGDPEKISLFGASAGGSSVHYHYLSKTSAGFFRNGVSFSGTALSPWAFDPKPLETTKKLASTVGCTTDSSAAMVNCLKNLPSRVLAMGTEEILKEITNLYYYYPLFMPVAEKNVTDYFIDRSPEDILRSGDVYDVPWTTGVVSHEGGLIISSFAFNKTKLSYTDKNWEKLTPYTLIYNKTLPVHMHTRVARAARQHYVHSECLTSNAQTIWGLLYMQTHVSFFIVLEKTTRLQAKVNKSPVYTYYYSYKAAMSETNYLSGTQFNFGTSHLDDIFLVLENKYIDPTTTKKDRVMLEVMLDFWFSMATTGKPSIINMELPKVDPKNSEFQYLDISGSSNNILQTSNNFGEKRFWSSLGYNLEL